MTPETATPDPLPEPPVHVRIADLSGAMFSGVVGGGIAYVVAGGVLQSETFKGILPYATMIQGALAIIVAVTATAVGYRDLRSKARTRAAARAAAGRVDEALKDLAAENEPGQIASVSTEAVAANVGDTTIEREQFERLIEQRKQQMLVNKRTLAPALSYLVENWHPLPRDVKRGLNRFYVSLLIAYNRRLLTGKDAVSAQQLAKWLVLSERWPQLGRALSAWPKRIEDLEKGAAEGPQAFITTLRALAPLYADDPDLQAFVAAAPHLVSVLPRLVQLGAAQPVQRTSQPVQSAPVAGESAAPSSTAVQ